MSSPVYLAKSLNRKYELAKHIQFIDSKLLDVYNKKINRLLVTIPPRHGKSELISKYFPSWYLLQKPSARIIICSYESEFASTWCRKCLQVIKQFKLPLVKETQNYFETKEGGYIQSVGIGGAITGKGADLFIIDDPVKNDEDALSPRKRQKAWDWYLSTASTRLEPQGAMVLIMTRWHLDDLAGKIIQEMGNGGEIWNHIDIPAIAGINDPLNRKEGEALWKERYPIEVLNDIKVKSGSYWFSALYQQTPITSETCIIKDYWWKFFTDSPKFDYVIHSYDTAFKTKEINDFTGFISLGLKDGNYYVIDYFNQKLEYPDLVKTVKAKFDLHRPNVVFIEDKGSGTSLIQELRAFLPIKEIKVVSDKLVRVHSVANLFEAGRVFIRPQFKEVITQFAEFPFAKHDDLVDAMCQALQFKSTPVVYNPVKRNKIDYYKL